MSNRLLPKVEPGTRAPAAPVTVPQGASVAAPITAPAAAPAAAVADAKDPDPQRHHFDKLGWHSSPLLPGLQAPLPPPLPRPGQWFTRDPETDRVEGTRADRAYAELNLPTAPTPRPVIVAVIDSGVDTKHEDLRGPLDADGRPTNPAQDRLWTNAREVPGDGVDNDGNGYVDDVNGWNFLGSIKDGQPVSIGTTTLEMVREKVRLDRLAQTRPLTAEEQAYLVELRAAIAEAATQFPAPYLDENFDPRKDIIGDDPYDYEHRGYGNNRVDGPHGDHGTHVAGIIAAIRDNAVGILGIASDVKIMPLRAVPDGDEYDKDVANAIRYAVDNGASIINMSFGKHYSPGKPAVDRAMAYAAAHGVLIVHAAGNDSLDLDDARNTAFPSRSPAADPAHPIPGWLEIGASGPTRGTTLPASFSNYGKDNVDVFAPGVGITSTVPGNRYQSMSGTSMATPVVAGVAAVIRSQYPQLSAVEVKAILERTARTYEGLEVFRPGSFGERVPFANLSRTGGVVDLLAALREASRVAGEKVTGPVARSSSAP